MKEDYLLNSS